jgi:ABC-type multidrug transport system ATPase subunit
VDLSKTFHKFSFGGDRSKDVHAVKSVYLEVPKNELLCLLGHNGAGKSTLFNMLTGMIGPTHGYAKIAGLDIRTQLDAIRKVMGVVPQFDILWDQLTAMEHMRMFSKIKGVAPEDLEEECNALLKKVGLEDVKNA